MLIDDLDPIFHIGISMGLPLRFEYPFFRQARQDLLQHQCATQPTDWAMIFVHWPVHECLQYL